jgi:hypothetical protein
MFFTILTPPRPYTNFPREVVSQIIGAGGLRDGILTRIDDVSGGSLRRANKVDGVW